jgi:hypothetical protein
VRWIRFSQGGRTAYGIVEGNRVAEVAGDPFGGYEPAGRAHDLHGTMRPTSGRPPPSWASRPTSPSGPMSATALSVP